MRTIVLLGSFTCILLVGLIAVPSCLAQPSTDSAPRPVVMISAGLLSGSLTYDGEAVFKDIPFAVPPVGNLRWREPQPAKLWAGIRDATKFGPACYQSGHLNVVSSEDCLQLNVWTPTWPMNTTVPVMVWFHGGGNVAGSAIEPLFNGESLARHGVILVTANYRLGPFGFLAHPELTKESPHHSSGNYGLLDQIMALRWVHENIARFGGDPSRVTIMGESAGSMDVNTLMTTPASEGLFERVIAESGAAGNAQSLAEAEKKGETFAAKLNITGDNALQKLRALSSEDLTKPVVPGLGPGTGLLGITVDGWVLPDSPDKAFAAGHEHKVALLFGNNSQEMRRPFGPQGDSIRAAITKHFGPLADRAFAVYGLNCVSDPQPDSEFGDVQTQWTTDSSFRCATIQELMWHADAGNLAFEYQFSISVHGKKSEGAPHAAEIPFIFGTLPVWQQARRYDLADRQYSPLIQEYWVNFAKTGDPNGTGLKMWPKFDSSTRPYIDFTDAGPVVRQGLRRQVCDLYMENEKRVSAKQP